jgi:hypothetical protein
MTPANPSHSHETAHAAPKPADKDKDKKAAEEESERIEAAIEKVLGKDAQRMATDRGFLCEQVAANANTTTAAVDTLITQMVEEKALLVDSGGRIVLAPDEPKTKSEK